MKTQVLFITPDMAQEMLKKNTANRPIRAAHVKHLAGLISRGEFALTHQGIAFDIFDKLIDGQHRLHAIIRADIGVHMQVTTNADPHVYRAVDQGARRNLSDLLSLGKRHAEVVRLAARYIHSVNIPSPAQAEPVAMLLGPFLTKLSEATTTDRRGVTAAPVRLAAAIRLLEGEDETYVISTYTALALAHLPDLPPIAQSFFVQSTSERRKVTSASADWLLAKALNVFTKEKSTFTALRVSIDATRAWVTWGKLGDQGRGLKSLRAAWGPWCVEGRRYFTLFDFAISLQGRGIQGRVEVLRWRIDFFNWRLPVFSIRAPTKPWREKSIQEYLTRLGKAIKRARG